MAWVVTWAHEHKPTRKYIFATQEDARLSTEGETYGWTFSTREIPDDSLEAFKLWAARHDITYMMSDDHCTWERGEASMYRLRRIMRALRERGEHKEAIAFWNAMADMNLIEDCRKLFHWRDWE